MDVEARAKSFKYLDVALILLLLLASFSLAMLFSRAKIAAGHTPQFYQSLFQPAVMIACGKGFVVTTSPDTKKLKDFLNLKSETFSCESLPSDPLAYRTKTFLRAWFYMEYAVGLTWKIFGISWANVSILVAFLFSLSALAIYGIFSLCMGRTLSLIGTALFISWPAQLNYLLALRDYSKAPFILFSIFILGYLVTKKLPWFKQLLLTLCLGVVVGVGYGFRPDVLIVLPISLVTLLFFLPRLNFKNFYKSVGLIICLLLSAYIAVYPVLQTFKQGTGERTMGTCQFHFVLLGLGNSFNHLMKIKPSIYETSYVFDDSYVVGMVGSYGNREMKLSDVGYCTKRYDKVSGKLYVEIFKMLPADYAIRMLAAEKNLLNQVPNFLKLYNSQGVFLYGAALILLLLLNFRFGFFYLLISSYFLTYPSLVFFQRHTFHLYFFQLWNIGVIITILLSLKDEKIREQFIFDVKNNYLKVSIFLLFVIVSIVSMLWALRFYQSKNVTHLIDTYLNAPRQPQNYKKVYSSNKVTYRISHPVTTPDNIVYSKMLHIALKNTEDCHQNSYKIKVDYTLENRYFYNFAKELLVNDLKTKQYNTDLFMPIYVPAGLKGKKDLRIDIIAPKSQEHCIKAINRIKSNDFYPIWTVLEVPSDRSKFPLYLTLK